jgi:hypothetical protein
VQQNSQTSTPDNLGKEIREISAVFKKSAVTGRLCTTIFDIEDSTFYQQSELMSLLRYQQTVIN